MTDLTALLAESGAVLHGHFLLTSGRHSAVYFEKFRILEQPRVLSPLCAEIARHFGGSVDVVMGPTTGGIIIAFEVARQLGVPALYVESEEGVRKLRRGARLSASSRVLIVDDVLTTGRSVRELLALVHNAGATAVGVGVLIDRSESVLDLGCPLFAAHEVEAESFAPDEVPDWLSVIPVTKPGTRQDPTQ